MPMAQAPRSEVGEGEGEAGEEVVGVEGEAEMSPGRLGRRRRKRRGGGRRRIRGREQITTDGTRGRGRWHGEGSRDEVSFINWAVDQTTANMWSVVKPHLYVQRAVYPVNTCSTPHLLYTSVPREARSYSSSVAAGSVYGVFVTTGGFCLAGIFSWAINRRRSKIASSPFHDRVQ